MVMVVTRTSPWLDMASGIGWLRCNTPLEKHLFICPPHVYQHLCANTTDNTGTTVHVVISSC
eukprot:23887-Eustigmatos_ZCMA.PRE.1